MFESLDFFQLVSKGGYTIVVLLACSVISVTVAIQKFILFWKMKFIPLGEIEKIKSAVKSSDFKLAKEIAGKNKTILGSIISESIEDKSGPAVRDVISVRISQEVLVLEKYLASLGTIGATAPFIGLLGTVVGIMRAFHDLGKYGVGNPSIVSAGIAEALIATAAGLLVAIPSVIIYNYFLKKIARLTTETENLAIEILSPLIYK